MKELLLTGTLEECQQFVQANRFSITHPNLEIQPITGAVYVPEQFQVWSNSAMKIRNIRWEPNHETL